MYKVVKERIALDGKVLKEDLVKDDDASSSLDEAAVTNQSETEDSSDTHTHAGSPLEHTALKCVEEAPKPVSLFDSSA